jgi:hypothetical protein
MSDTETTTEDPRVTLARALLADSKAATDRPASGLRAATWWGRVEAALEDLLAYVDERGES